MVDLRAQRQRIDARISAAIARVLDHGQYVSGPEVDALESLLARRLDGVEVVACSSGTDALFLALQSLGVGRGDAVIVPSFTFVATAQVVAQCGAVPVFADVRADTFDLDPESLASVTGKSLDGLRLAAIIPVDLFGHPADYLAIEEIAGEVPVIADVAQSFGARSAAGAAGAVGTMAATSFFPSKPLGCYGDGGAVFTRDGALAEVVRSLRLHGQGRHRYEHVRIGINGRLDTLQAAILLEKLEIFDDEVRRRREVATRYEAGLGHVVRTPAVRPDVEPSWAQYTIRVDNRDEVAAALRGADVASAVHYPLPIHKQPAYCGFPVAPGGCPVSETLSNQVLSLPMHPYLQPDEQDRVVETVRLAVA